MGQLLGVGISHFPGFLYPDDQMSGRLVSMLANGSIAEPRRDPATWPEAMRAEWGDDQGAGFAARHRADFLDGARAVRAALDDFRPEAVIIFGDDQYENFREDLIPPFAVYIRDRFRTQPFLKGRAGLGPSANIWDLDREYLLDVPGHDQLARRLVADLLDAGFDLPYSYTGHHLSGLGHAYANTLLYLDYDRTGWDYPVIPFHVNAYGSKIVVQRGGVPDPAGTDATQDPPGPSPARCFDLGAALARALLATDLRVAIVASSSWSHAFLTPANGYLYPDLESDRRRFEELARGDYALWRDLDRAELEAAGQQELLNWVPLAGAMTELGAGAPRFSSLAETYTMNSSKCAIIFDTVGT